MFLVYLKQVEISKCENLTINLNNFKIFNFESDSIGSHTIFVENNISYAIFQHTFFPKILFFELKSEPLLVEFETPSNMSSIMLKISLFKILKRSSQLILCYISLYSLYLELSISCQAFIMYKVLINLAFNTSISTNCAYIFFVPINTKQGSAISQRSLKGLAHVNSV